MKIIPCDDDTFGLDVEFAVFDKINALQVQRDAVAANEMLNEDAFKEMAKSMVRSMGMQEEVFEKMRSAVDYTKNEDALRAMTIMKRNRERAMEDIKADLESFDAGMDEGDGEEIKIRAMVGWFDDATEIQKASAARLVQIQESVIEAMNGAVRKFITANTKSIKKEMTQMGQAVVKVPVLNKDAEAIGLYHIEKLLLHPTKPEVKIIGKVRISGYFTTVTLDGAVVFRDAGHAISVKSVKEKS